MVETVVDEGATVFGGNGSLAFGSNNSGSVGLSSVSVGTDFLLSVGLWGGGITLNGLGAGGEADNAAADTGTRHLTGLVNHFVNDDSSTDNALGTRKINKVVFLIDVGLTVLVGNSESEVTDFNVTIIFSTIAAVR